MLICAKQGSCQHLFGGFELKKQVERAMVVMATRPKKVSVLTSPGQELGGPQRGEGIASYSVFYLFLLVWGVGAEGWHSS